MDIRDERRIRRNQIVVSILFFTVTTLGLLYLLGLL